MSESLESLLTSHPQTKASNTSLIFFLLSIRKIKSPVSKIQSYSKSSDDVNNCMTSSPETEKVKNGYGECRSGLGTKSEGDSLSLWCRKDTDTEKPFHCLLYPRTQTRQPHAGRLASRCAAFRFVKAKPPEPQAELLLLEVAKVQEGPLLPADCGGRGQAAWVEWEAGQAPGPACKVGFMVGLQNATYCTSKTVPGEQDMGLSHPSC